MASGTNALQRKAVTIPAHAASAAVRTDRLASALASQMIGAIAASSGLWTLRGASDTSIKEVNSRGLIYSQQLSPLPFAEGAATTDLPTSATPRDLAWCGFGRGPPGAGGN